MILNDTIGPPPDPLPGVVRRRGRAITRWRVMPVMALGLLLTMGLRGDPVRGADPPASSNSTPVPIERQIGPVRLGMKVQEFQETLKNTEQVGPGLGLLENERSFEVDRGGLPEGMSSMGCRFLDDQLYRITVDFREGYFDEARWNETIKKHMEQYGKAPIQSPRLKARPTDLIQWDDDRTRFLIQREHRMRLESEKRVIRFTVMMVLLDRALWEKREASEISIF